MTKNSIWITGADGRLGKCLKKELKKNSDYKIIATDLDMDITDLKAVEQTVKIYKPTIIINCASLSDAEYCETHRAEAYKVNALGARNLASVSRQINAKIIHFSTDDVFCGEHDRPKNEFDFPTPDTVFGLSKLAGETFIRELNPKHLIIRSSWMYGSGKGSYFDTVVEHAKKGETFTANVDCFSTPTNIHTVIQCLMKILEADEYGIFHIANEGMCSRHQYATAILSLMGYDTNLAQPSFRNQNTVVRSTVLENLMLEVTDIYKMPDWLDDLKSYVDSIK